MKFLCYAWNDGSASNGGPLKSFYPFESKDVADFFGKPYTQPLGAGFELHSAQILCGRFSWGFAKQCHQSSSK
jgi:hypothetical protein